jgi:hypothetical protein
MRRNNYTSHNTNIVHMIGDNMGAIELTKNPHLNERSKHINIYHFVRDRARNRHLQVSYVPTANIVADEMTKPLQCVAFERFKNQLRIVR